MISTKKEKKQPQRYKIMILFVILFAFIIPITTLVLAVQNYREYKKNREAMLIEKQKEAEVMDAKLQGLRLSLEKIVDQYQPEPLQDHAEP